MTNLVYEMQCLECGIIFEVQEENKEPAVCPNCGKEVGSKDILTSYYDLDE